MVQTKTHSLISFQTKQKVKNQSKVYNQSGCKNKITNNELLQKHWQTRKQNKGEQRQ